MTTLYTIGHSNHEITKFLTLLNEHNIQQLVDVRSSPYSKFNLHFNREILESKLKQQSIDYFFAGSHLGGRPKDPSCYKQHVLPKEGTDYLHEVNYPEVMKKTFFLQGIRRLLMLAEQNTTTIMCSEENPAQCHRHHLIAKYLLSEYPTLTILHIRGDGMVYNAKTVLDSVGDVPAEQPSLFNF